MTRVLFGTGARGPLIVELQQALTQKGFAAAAADGLYGPSTAAAVSAFQQSAKEPITGQVSPDDWTGITDTPAPDIEARCLQLTSTFEGHGYSVAAGNWDGAWLTWGIIGFTLRAGQIQTIIRNVQQHAPACVTQAFGDESARVLQMIDAPAAQQMAWANSVSDGSRVLEPWRSHFATFGSLAPVQAEQRVRAHADYFVPAMATAHALGLTTELGIALCFDIHVQNGSVAPSTCREILAQHIGRPEPEILEALANAVADEAKPQFREDVRARKLAIARGEGTVHGLSVRLSNWGLTAAAVTV